jgi:CO/xanthine dehydrogenase Mo-binding subunit
MSTHVTTSTRTSVPALLGHDEARIDGRLKVSGQAKYTADYAREGMLWAAFATSPYPHARIVRIDTTAAKALPGVHAVVTGADVGERYFGCLLNDWPVLAVERVNFVGEYVAAVAAETREIADAAAAAIDIEYEELTPFLDPEAAIAAGAPVLHPNDDKFPYTGPPRGPLPSRNMQGYDKLIKGDPAAAFARAERVFEHTFRTPRYHAGYLEPRATLVWIDDDAVVHVISSNKTPFALRDMIARTTGVPKEKVVVEPSFIGGEFGAKALTIEEFPLYYLALATGKPVKHVRTYIEDVRSSHVRHASTVRVRIGTKGDGTIVAVDVRALFDGGAYGAQKPVPGILPGRTPKFPYKIEHLQCERIAAYTNTIPAAFLRAPGDVQITFAFESMIDMIATELQIDPLEFRLLNAPGLGDTDVDGNPFADPRSREVLAALRTAMPWDTPTPPGRGRGIGLTARHIAGGKTSFIVTVQPDGTLAVDTGSTEPGVGTFTVIQRVLAGELGVDPARVTVTRGTTSSVPWDPGIGGSKGTNILGHAALDAARQIRAERERVEAVHLDWDAAARALTRNGPFRVIGAGESIHTPGEPIWLNFGVYGVEVSVDRETGKLTLHDVVFVADVGTIINPIAHRGQIDGGFLMGLGHALTEELVVDEGRIVNLALSDYKLPCQRDMPPFRVICLEPGDGPGPYGARAAGEFNTAGVAPAIANAIADACGVRLDVLGLTAERIYDALQAQPA